MKKVLAVVSVCVALVALALVLVKLSHGDAEQENGQDTEA